MRGFWQATVERSSELLRVGEFESVVCACVCGEGGRSVAASCSAWRWCARRHVGCSEWHASESEGGLSTDRVEKALHSQTTSRASLASSAERSISMRPAYETQALFVDVFVLYGLIDLDSGASDPSFFFEDSCIDRGCG